MNNVGKVLCLLALLCGGEVVWARISLLKLSGGGFVKNGCYQQVQSVSMEEALEQVGCNRCQQVGHHIQSASQYCTVRFVNVAEGWVRVQQG